MIETRTRVIRAANGMAWVAANEQSGCSACQSQQTCGISGLGKFMSRRRPALPIRRADARVGDELLVCVDETELLRAGLFAYLLPTLLAVVGTALADAVGAGDLVAALTAASGFVVGLVAARFLAPKPRIRTSPIYPTIPRSNP